MYSDELIVEQRQRAEAGLMTLRQLLPLMVPVTSQPEWKADERETILSLLSATARASESALLLCAFGQLWDAEILVRSVLEGSLKFAYLLQSPDSFSVRHSEYAQDLFSIALVKDHHKCEELLRSVPNPDHAEWRPIRDRLLSPKELKERIAAHDRVHRRELENRWGFTGLVVELTRSGDPLFRYLSAMAHAYSIASHIHHMDMIGSSIPLDRDRRTPQRRESIHIAHEERLIFDVLVFLYMRLTVGYRFVGANAKPLLDAKAMIDNGTAKFENAERAWMDVEYGNVTVSR